MLKRWCDAGKAWQNASDRVIPPLITGIEYCTEVRTYLHIVPHLLELRRHRPAQRGEKKRLSAGTALMFAVESRDTRGLYIGSHVSPVD